MYSVIDFETTGLDYKEDQVTEIGIVKLDENFNEIGRFHTFVKLYNDNKLSKFTDITEEQLASGMDILKAIKLVKMFIENTVVVAQWAPFDLGFLHKMGVTDVDFICTKTITALAEPDESSSLGPTCKRNGITLVNAHRALDDAQATADLFRYRILEQDFNTEALLNVVSVTEGRPMNFLPNNLSVIMTKAGEDIYVK